MEDVFAKIRKVNKDIVLSNTWGHLYPKDNKEHDGYILYTHTAYGDIECIDCHFKGIEDSPWFFQDMNNFIADNCRVRGHIYLFKGTYRKLKNQKAVFKGKIKRITIEGLK